MRYFEGNGEGAPTQWQMPSHGIGTGSVRWWNGEVWSEWWPSHCTLKDMFSYTPDQRGEYLIELAGKPDDNGPRGDDNDE